jgi:hypothetical protein
LASTKHRHHLGFLRPSVNVGKIPAFAYKVRMEADTIKLKETDPLEGLGTMSREHVAAVAASLIRLLNA